jgi:hypothetical protein
MAVWFVRLALVAAWLGIRVWREPTSKMVAPAGGVISGTPCLREHARNRGDLQAAFAHCPIPNIQVVISLLASTSVVAF